MNIAIADDDANDLKAVVTYCQKHIRSSFQQAEKDVHIETFSSGEELLEAFLPGKYDLIILDIYMKDLSGMETAKKIRGQDTGVNIIFLTSSMEHILEGYRVFAVGYFIKPLDQHIKEFTATFDHIFSMLLQEKKEIVLRVNGVDVEIACRDICYVNIGEKEHILIHLPEQVLETTTSYNSVQEALLSESRFMECHYRIIINMDYVEAMEQENFLMMDGTRIPISRRKKQEVKRSYMNHLINR